MDVGASAASKSFKEVMDELRLQVAYGAHANFGIYNRRGAAAEIHCSGNPSFCWNTSRWVSRA